MTTSAEMMSLQIIERRRFVLRNNRKVAGEWLVYGRDALPVSHPFITNAEMDQNLDRSKICGTAVIENETMARLPRRLPEGVTPEDIRRAILGLDG